MSQDIVVPSTRLFICQLLKLEDVNVKSKKKLIAFKSLLLDLSQIVIVAQMQDTEPLPNHV